MSAKADGGLVVFRKAQLSSSHCFLLIYVYQGTRELKFALFLLFPNRVATCKHFWGCVYHLEHSLKVFHAWNIKFSFLNGVNVRLMALATKSIKTLL